MGLPDSLDRFVSAMAPPHDEVQAAMATEAEERGFPIIGRAAGGVLQAAASARSAEAIFEFGSGFGYSATWFLKGLASDGELVLTERDAENVATAKEYLGRTPNPDRVRFEHGDALEIVERYDGPFDIVLLDHDKAAYLEGLERVTGKLRPGGIVIADNILRGPVGYEDILPYLTERDDTPADDTAAGLVAYLRSVRDRDDFHTTVLPIGNGLAVSVYVRS